MRRFPTPLCLAVLLASGVSPAAVAGNRAGESGAAAQPAPSPTVAIPAPGPNVVRPGGTDVNVGQASPGAAGGSAAAAAPAGAAAVEAQTNAAAVAAEAEAAATEVVAGAAREPGRAVTATQGGLAKTATTIQAGRVNADERAAIGAFGRQYDNSDVRRGFASDPAWPAVGAKESGLSGRVYGGGSRAGVFGPG